MIHDDLNDDLSLDIKGIWDAYQFYAEHSGADKETKGIQEGYSLWWFFAYLAGQPDFPQCLSPLTHAFFADPKNYPEFLKQCAPAAGPSLPSKPKKGDHVGRYEPNARQWAAIRAALSSPISFIQGPPGTGKTETILNLLYQISKRGLRAAVVSSNDNALANIHSKLDKLKKDGLDGGLADRVARLGNASRREGFKKKVKFSSTSCWCYRTEPAGGVKLVPPDPCDKDTPQDRDAWKKEWIKDRKKDGEEDWKKAWKEEGEKAWKEAWEKGWQKQHPDGIAKYTKWESELTAEAFFDAGYIAFTTTAHSLPACFADGLCHLYDYVIVDEASQMDYLAGIMTMCHAKRLILVGDEKQLAPILNREALGEVERDYTLKEPVTPEGVEETDDERMYDEIAYEAHPDMYEDFAEWLREQQWLREDTVKTYFPQEEKSFLDFCLELFSPVVLEEKEDIPPQTACKVFLEEHYRCRRGIIEFCNKEVYDGELLPMRKEPGVPIKILYFEGDYCQRCFWSPEQKDGKAKEPGADPSEPDELERACRDWGYRLPPARRPATSKANAKQVEIFLAEELPQLKERIEENDKLTACILTPFNGEREAIRRAIQRIDGITLSTASAYGQKKVKDVLCLQSSSVHKAQGKEYDIVYLLPVEDGDWEGAFSQKQRMVNVAVSRAKEELRIITSTKYMSTNLQEKLGVTHPRQGPEEEGGELFLRKLADYVQENVTPKDKKEFGFHKTTLVSVFDHKEYNVSTPAKKGKSKSSAGEVRIKQVLEELVDQDKKGLELKEQVYIQTVLEQLGHTTKGPHSDIFEEYLSHKASFDFVLYQEGTPFLAIEVDGAYHRFPLIKSMDADEPEKSKEERYQAFRKRWMQDREKDALVREVLDGQVFYGNTRRYVDEWRADETEREIDQWHQPRGAFALLRLPDDGTTYLEIDKLWKEAPEEVQKKVFTLEKLIKRYRPAGDTVSLAVALRTWTQAERDRILADLKGKGSLVSKVQPRLAEMGLLEDTPDGWRPTEAGRAMGIQERRKEKFYPVYSRAAQDEIKKRLLKGKKR